MSRICPECGAENRDSAKFCLKCASQIADLGFGPDTEIEAPKRRRRKKRRRNSGSASKRRTSPLLLGVALLSLVALFAVPLLMQSSPAGSGKPATSPVAAAADDTGEAKGADKRANSAPAAEVVAVASSALVPVIEAKLEPESEPKPEANPEPAPEPAEQLVAASPASSAASAVSLAAPSTVAQKVSRAEQQRRQQQQRATAAKQRAAKAAPPEKPAPVVVASAPAAVPSPPPTPPKPAALCAGGNVFSRQACLQRECTKAGMRQHPQCRRMFELQESLQRKPN